MAEEPNEVNIIYHTIEATEEMENPVEGVPLVDFVTTADGEEGEQVQLAYLEVQDMEVDQSSGFPEGLALNSSHFILTQDGGSGENKFFYVVNDKNGSAQLLNSEAAILEGDSQEASYGNGLNAINESGPSTSSAEGCLEVQETEYNETTMYIDGDRLLQLKGNVEGFQPETAIWAKLHEKVDGTEMLFIPSNPDLASSILRTSNGDKSDRNRNLMHLACIAGELQSVQIEEDTELEETVVETEDQGLEVPVDMGSEVANDETEIIDREASELTNQEISEQPEHEFDTNVSDSVIENADELEVVDNSLGNVSETTVIESQHFVEHETVIMIDTDQQIQEVISEEQSEDFSSQDLFDNSFVETDSSSRKVVEEETIPKKSKPMKKVGKKQLKPTHHSRHSKRSTAVSKGQSQPEDSKASEYSIQDVEIVSSNNDNSTEGDVGESEVLLTTEPKVLRKSFRHIRKQSPSVSNTSDSFASGNKTAKPMEDTYDISDDITDLKHKLDVLQYGSNRKRTTSTASVNSNSEDASFENSMHSNTRSSNKGNRNEKESFQKEIDSCGIKDALRDFSSLASELDKDIEMISTATSDGIRLHNGKLPHSGDLAKDDSTTLAKKKSSINDFLSQNSEPLVMQPPKKTYTRTRNLSARSDVSGENNSIHDNSDNDNYNDDKDSLNKTTNNVDGLDKSNDSQSETIQSDTAYLKRKCSPTSDQENRSGVVIKKQKKMVLPHSRNIKPTFLSSQFHQTPKKRKKNFAKSTLALKKKSGLQSTYGTLSKSFTVTTASSVKIRKRSKSADATDPFDFKEDEANDFSDLPFHGYSSLKKTKRRGRPIGSRNRVVNSDDNWNKLLKSPKKVRKYPSILPKLQKSAKRNSLNLDNDASHIQTVLCEGIQLGNGFLVLPETPKNPRLTLKETYFTILDGSQFEYIKDNLENYLCPYCDYACKRIGNYMHHFKNCDIRDLRYSDEVTNISLRRGIRGDNDDANALAVPQITPFILYNPEASLFDICQMNTFVEMYGDSRKLQKEFATYHARVISRCRASRLQEEESNYFKEKDGEKDKLTVLSNQIVNHVLDGFCNSHIIEIYGKIVPSKRHDDFVARNTEGRREKNVDGPLSNSKHKRVHDYLEDLFKSVCKQEDLENHISYINDVWCPEAVIKSICDIEKKTREDAESYYDDCKVLLTFDHSSLDILKSAAKNDLP